MQDRELLAQALPSPVYYWCRNTLQECGEFDSDRALQAVFVTIELAPFRERLPEGTSRQERVDLCLDYLLRKRLTDGRPAISAFLLSLRDRYSEGDHLRDQLGMLSDAVDAVLALLTAAQEATESYEATAKGKPVGKPGEPNPGLKWLLDQITKMLATGRITNIEYAVLEQIFVDALSSDIDESLNSMPSASAVPVKFGAGYSSGKGITSELAIDDEQEGDANMTAGNPSTVNLTRSLFTKTARLLARDLADVVQRHAEWPDLIVGDEVTDMTVRSFRAIQNHMRMVDALSVEYIPPSARRRFQMERDAMIDSALQLTNIFEQLGAYQASGRVPRNVMAQMDRQLDDLSYYTSRCLLWLNDLTQSVSQGGVEAM